MGPAEGKPFGQLRDRVLGKPCWGGQGREGFNRHCLLNLGQVRGQIRVRSAGRSGQSGRIQQPAAELNWSQHVELGTGNKQVVREGTA